LQQPISAAIAATIAATVAATVSRRVFFVLLPINLNKQQAALLGD